MAIQLACLDPVIVRRAGRRQTPRWPADPRIRTAAGAIVRSLLIGLGLGLGVTVSLGHPGGVVIGIATVGVLAIGAAATSWDT